MVAGLRYFGFAPLLGTALIGTVLIGTALVGCDRASGAAGAPADAPPIDAGPIAAGPIAAGPGADGPVDVVPRPTALVAIPALTYRPMFRGKAGAATVELAPFRIEECAVTNEQFLDFVRANPKWRRSRVVRLFADATYLAHWRGDVDLPDGLADRPVTNVSWFAARAYARWIGRRLPTTAEWEAVAAASDTRFDGRDEPGFTQRILDWYGRPTPAVPGPVRSTFVNAHGVWDMHGLVWEWVADFGSALVTGESRADPGLERNLFCGAGSIGSVDPEDYAAFMRYAFRSSLVGDYAVRNLGFRCVSDTDPQPHKE